MRKFLFGGAALVGLTVAYALASGAVLSNPGSLILLALVVLLAALLPMRRPNSAGMLALPALASIMAAMIFWQAAPAVHAYPTVTLTVTGEKNPSALAAEVWLAGLGGASKAPNVNGFEGWAPRGEAVVGYEGTRKTIRVPRAWSGDSFIRLGKGPYSGIVEITVDDAPTKLDLYSPTADSIDVALPNPVRSASSLPLGLFSTLLFAWAGFLLIARFAHRRASFRYVIVFSAILTGMGVWVLMSQTSAVGDLEMLIVDSSAGGADLLQGSTVLGTRSAYAEQLPLSVDNYASQAFLDLRDASELTLEANAAPVAIWKEAGNKNAREKTLTCSRERPLVAQFGPQGVVSVRLIEGPSHGALVAPELPTPESDRAAPAGRRYLVCWPYHDGLLLAWSSAYLKYGAWQGPVSAVERVRVDTLGKPVLVLRLFSGTTSFALSSPQGDHEFAIPRIATPLSHADQARRIATALISALVVLLVVPLGALYKLVCELASRGQGWATIFCLAIVVAWMAFTLLMAWPGIIGWDAISPFIQHGTGAMALWYGVGYPLFVSAMINLGGPELSLLLKVLLIGVVALWVALRALDTQAKGWLVCVYLVCMLAFSGTTMVVATELRDAVNGVALSAFGVYSFALLTRYFWSGQPPQVWQYMLLTIVGAMIVLLRTDNIVFVGVLLAGFAFGRHWRKTLPVCVAVGALWIGVTPAVVQYVMENGDHGQGEMLLYKQSTFVNPLVGMLRGNSLNASERAELSTTLDKVLDVDQSIERWTPSDVVYWHVTEKGQGTPEILAELQKAFILNALRHPMEFATLRTVTSLKALGMNSAAAWLAQEYTDRPFSQPPYFDHLAGTNAYWRSMVILAGYRPAAHIFPSMTAQMHSWYELIALGTPQLLLALLLIFGVRRVPVTALVAGALVARAGVFWVFQPASVFLYLAELQILGTLLPLLAWIEYRQRSSGKQHVN